MHMKEFMSMCSPLVATRNLRKLYMSVYFPFTAAATAAAIFPLLHYHYRRAIIADAFAPSRAVQSALHTQEKRLSVYLFGRPSHLRQRQRILVRGGSTNSRASSLTLPLVRSSFFFKNVLIMIRTHSTKLPAPVSMHSSRTTHLVLK